MCEVCVDYLCIIVIFLSAVWTLILTAPIHCRGPIGEEVMECYISPNLFWWTNKLIWMAWGLVKFQQIFHFGVKYALNCIEMCGAEVSRTHFCCQILLTRTDINNKCGVKNAKQWFVCSELYSTTDGDQFKSIIMWQIRTSRHLLSIDPNGKHLSSQLLLWLPPPATYWKYALWVTCNLMFVVTEMLCESPKILYVKWSM